jgi:hypothetical protein
MKVENNPSLQTKAEKDKAKASVFSQFTIVPTPESLSYFSILPK